ncbi:MAG: tRNA lysidine(34) synthetase TilS [Trueperaceae bacterium]|nr:tRNA lysidine(34) synthetase TilS [Trueperaceae bacterium]
MPASPTIPEQIATTLRSLAPRASAVVVAVSGGSDSVAVLRALHRAHAAGDAPALVAAHLDHGLRPASSSDAAWVQALCDALAVPLAREAVRVGEIARREGGNVEEVARTLRYAFLTRTAKAHGADAIVTGHTRDDAAETVLLQLLRGSAHPRGIRAVRGRVVRPALQLSKRDLRQFLDGLGQSWREDASNWDVSGGERAWIRHDVVPRLETRRPGAAARLARFGLLQRDQAEFLRAEAERRFGARGPLPRRALALAPRALAREALAGRVRAAGGTLDGLHLDALLDALPGEGATRRDVPGGVRVRILGGRVEVLARGAMGAPAAPAFRRVADPGALPAGVPAGVLAEGPLTLRGWRPGDRIRLAAGTRTVADLLGERGVPREDRPAVRVLARDDAVVWVEGIAVAAPWPAAAYDADEPFMRRALAWADRAAAAGELPVGAVVVRDGEVLGEGANAREGNADPLGHAETLAMRAAAATDGDWRLAGATLYVTLEPCPMCAGAILQSQLARVVWGADNRRDGAFGSVVDLGAGPWKRVPALRGGVLAREAAHRLARFFAARRVAGAPSEGA